MGQDLDPIHTEQTAHLELVDRELVSLMDDPEAPDRLMLFMPPQEGKSQRVSRRFPLWLLAHDPTLRIGIVSYESESATRWGRQIKRDLEANPELGIRLVQDSRAAGRWETDRGGGLYCVGINGALTGKPLDVLIVDDPVKDRAAAESRLIRETAWSFWENVGKLRLSSRGKVVLVMTRWHHDDLAGRLMAKEPGEWRIVSIPGIAEDGDILGRDPGEELASVQHRLPGYFRKLMESMSRYVFLSLIQQRPSSAEGNLFKREDGRYWEPVGSDRFLVDSMTWPLSDCRRFITVDLATSLRSSADYSVAAAWAITPNGDMLLLDRKRERVEEGGHFDLVDSLRSRWLGPYDVVHVESRMFGTTLVYAAGRRGIPIRELKADADKLTRALVAADLSRQHRLWWPRNADWIDVWVDELAEFPTGAHDDQVDVLAYAARVAVTEWLPVGEDDTTTADGSGDGWDDGGTVDFMTAQF